MADYLWDSIKEDRGKYFVEYLPLREESLFASLNLVFLAPENTSEIAILMEKEFDIWISLFPLPIMVSSFDDKGDLISLNGVRPTNHLVGFVDFKTGKLIKQWKLFPNEAFPKEQLEEDYVKEVYKGLSYKTKDELMQQKIKHRKQLRKEMLIIFMWAVVVPAILAILGFANFWIGLMVLIYSLWKTLVRGLKMMGKWEKSEIERQKEAKELKMQHYYYHCERNPEGFRKIVIENLEEDERERIKKEAESLRSYKSNK